MGNSVIYRPAYDAEVEYLESTGTQYIDTGIVASSELGIIAHIAVMNDNTTYLFGGADGLFNAEYGFMAATGNNTSSFRFGSKTTNRSLLNIGVNYEFDNTSNHNVLTVGETSYQAQFNEFISSFNFYLFAENRSGSSWKGTGVRIYDFKIYQNSTLVRDFIPVRIGSIGYMYDKVTKQLFANKGTGNFILGNDVVNAVIPQQRCVLYFGSQRSVVFERIYEVCDKLIVEDGRCAFPLNSEVFECTIENLSNNNNVVILQASSRYTYHYKSNEDNTSSALTCWDLTQNTDVVGKYHLNNPSTFISDGTTFKCNGSNVTKYGFPPDSIDIRSSHSFKISISAITVDGIERYIPCKLLQSIPAILDGNGIARQAGECGMWDKVSNRFYGNVASSGTFTVKGPKCYEEYKWLKAVCPVNKTMMTLPIGSQKFNWKVKIEQLGNISYIRSDNYSYYTASNTAKIVHIWDIPNEVTIFSAQTARTEGMIVNISSTSESLTFNEEIIPKYGFSNIEFLVRNAINGARDAITYISSITIDGSVRYVPCKLTHGIPASMDAYGIARPAGTCGMWDKVNDKFYGNVANTGNFTVSND